MRTMVGLIFLVALVFFAFAYSHSLSIDRARFMQTANDLLNAHLQFQQHGKLTNQSNIFTSTNRVTIGGAFFQGEFVANNPDLARFGSLIVTTNERLIWIDAESGPVVVYGLDRKIVIPHRFHSF